MSAESGNDWFSYLDSAQQHQQQHEKRKKRERGGLNVHTNRIV